MKTEVLQEILKEFNVGNEIIQKIQAESGKDVTDAKNKLQAQIDTLTGQVTDLTGQVTQRDADLTDLKQKLTDAGASSTKLAEVQTSLQELQTKYDTEKNDWQAKMAKQNYEFLAKEAISGIGFTSNAAKKEFLAGLIEKNLPIENGALIGINDYITAQKTADPGAFKEEDNGGTPNQPPKFIPPPQPNPAPNAESKFNFGFIGVRPHETK